jgi:hypothetical protein
MKNWHSYDEALVRLADLIANTESLIADADSSPCRVEGHLNLSEFASAELNTLLILILYEGLS